MYRVPGFDRVTAMDASSLLFAARCTGCLDLTGLQLERIDYELATFVVYRVPGFDRVTARSRPLATSRIRGVQGSWI